MTGTKIAGSNPDNGRVENDYYATPFMATEAILKHIDLGKDTILEPSAGEGHIVKVLKDHYPNNRITMNDIAFRESRFGYDIMGGVDFLTFSPDRKWDTVITNPPFKYAQEFVEKALSIANHYVIMFIKIQFLEGMKRRKLFDEHPPKYVYVFSKRVNTLWNGEETTADGKPLSTVMCFAWFVWEIGYTGEPIIRWL